MSKEVLTQTKEKMEKAIAAYQRELATVRAGRANPSLLDKVTVEYYGAQTPLNQLSSINVPEARMLVITPYDKSAIGDIEKAILKADLGLTPTSDGNMIRIAIPALTEERRKELVKVVKNMLKTRKWLCEMYAVMRTMISKNLRKAETSLKTNCVLLLKMFKN